MMGGMTDGFYFFFFKILFKLEHPRWNGRGWVCVGTPTRVRMSASASALARARLCLCACAPVRACACARARARVPMPSPAWLCMSVPPCPPNPPWPHAPPPRRGAALLGAAPPGARELRAVAQRHLAAAGGRSTPGARWGWGRPTALSQTLFKRSP